MVWGMARDGVAVDARLVAAVAARVRGERVEVAVVCRELGVSRKTFYKYLARFKAEGAEGFFLRSRRPRSSPAATPEAIEDLIVRARKDLEDEGGDNGAISIGWRLEKYGIAAPSRMTIHRILQRRGLVIAQPAKGPRPQWRRFTAPHPNAMWQLDGLETTLADGSTAIVLQVMDDCSRLDLADRAAVSENGDDAWALLLTAAERYGLPQVLLSDNSLAFNGHRRGVIVDLQRRLQALGVKPVSSRTGHPQTCGKNERGHQTLQRWLAKQPVPGDLAELQQRLDAYRPWYNEQRRHQSLDGLTPQQRWDVADRVGPDGKPLPPPTLILHREIAPNGAVAVDGCEIGIDRRLAGHPAIVFLTSDHASIFVDNEHARTLTLDRSRDYQPTGKPRGKPQRS
jgi:transposase InsO family protein